MPSADHGHTNWANISAMERDNQVVEVERAYDEDVHLISVPKPLEGERLGLTVQEENGCVVVTRVLSGGLVDNVGHIGVGNVILEINNIQVHSADDLQALVAMADKSVQFLVKRLPEKDLKRYGIPNTPKLRQEMNAKATTTEQRVLCHLRALFDYDPYLDNLIPCVDAGLPFEVRVPQLVAAVINRFV